MKPATGAVDTQRLFFALWPDADLQQRLAAASLALLPPHSGGRHVPPENLHCTLLFLGAVGAAQRLCVEAAADRVRAAPFSLVLDRFGYFRRPQVAWLGCSTTPSMLSRLVTDLARVFDRVLLDLTISESPAETWLAFSGAGPAASDLAWFRAGSWREGIAQLFDGAEGGVARGIGTIEVVTAAGADPSCSAWTPA